MRIAHIADLHVRGITRHEEYKKSFEIFFQKCREEKVDHIFVGGDIWHTKTRGITPESIRFLSWLFNELGKVAPTHMILGNHDMNCANLERQDAISPILDALQNPRVTLYKDSGIYEFAPGWNWCVFSMADEENWSKVKPVPGAVNIACFHGSIRGAVTDMNFELEGNTTAAFFANFDFCFLGDIHRMQFLDLREYEIIIDEKDLHFYPDAEIIEEIQNEC